MIKRHLFIFLILCLALAACNIQGGSAQVSNEMSTAAAQTVQAVLSSPTVIATASPVPGVAIDGTTAEPPTSTCEDIGTFTEWTRDGETYNVDAVNKRIPPKGTFHMAWTLKNT